MKKMTPLEQRVLLGAIHGAVAITVAGLGVALQNEHLILAAIVFAIRAHTLSSVP